jgi:hypothetical protein
VANSVPGGHSNKCPNFAKPCSLAATKIGNCTLMEISKTINTEIITNRTRFTIFVFIFIAGGTALTGYLVHELHSLVILFVGIFTFLLFPFIFQKTFRKKFTQTVSVGFSDNLFSVEFKDLFTEDVVREDINRFDEIKYFKTWDSNQNDFSTLKLIFRDGTKVNYAFSGQKNDDRCETDINWLFRNAVEAYNASRKMDEKIKIIPSFYSTKGAFYLGVVLTFAMAFVTIYYGIQNPKVFIVSIGYIGIFSQMVAMRKKAIKEKNKFG